MESLEGGRASKRMGGLKILKGIWGEVARKIHVERGGGGGQENFGQISSPKF